MANDDWKLQASFKFGRNAEAMLNVRANTPPELDTTCQAVQEVVGTLVVLQEMLRAESVVTESFPGTTRVDSQNNAAPTYKDQPAQTTQGFNTPSCDHGLRVKRSGGQGRDAWEGWFCPLDKTHPERCKPLYPNKR